MTEAEKQYKNLLLEFLKFKSISTDSTFLPDILKTAKWLEQLFAKNKFETSIWYSKDNPVIFASHELQNISKKDAQTILIYGHYDVQPAPEPNSWKSNPFSLGEDSKRLYGRGVVDNKGQILVHIATILSLIQSKQLGVNIKFLIEGNEETGNTTLSRLMIKHKSKLECDYVLVSDGELTNNKPTIEMSLRGGFNATLTFKTAKSNLHSGIWGGAVPNAAFEISKFISKLYDKNNTINFRSFYLGVDKISNEQLYNNKLLEKETASLTKLAGVKQLLKEKGYDFYTSTGLRPTIQVTGIKSGYIEDGYSNIVPAIAEVKLNFRTTTSQKYNSIMKAFEKFVAQNTPKYVDYAISFHHPHNPVKLPTKSKHFTYIESLLEKVYGYKVNRRYVGGAIPFVADAKSILGKDVILVPLANEDCNMHGINENFDKKYLKKALEFSTKLFSA